MEKDFLGWHDLKSKINKKRDRAFFHEREVWWCSVGLNIGFEEDGKSNDFARPVLIIKVFNKEVFVAVPLTTKIKDGRYYEEIVLGDGVSQRVILSQIRLMDSKRLQNKITTIDKERFGKIKKAVIQLLE